jgi:GntR family transcriptional regulator
MILVVDPALPLPIYEQICEQVRLMIASGSIPDGEQLPTMRQLASDLGIAKGTVTKAYETLAREGLVTSRGRHGTVVVGIGDAEREVAAERRIREVARQLALTAVQVGASSAEVWRMLNEELARLRPARP